MYVLSLIHVGLQMYIRYWRRPRAGDRKRANLLAGSLARVIPAGTKMTYIEYATPFPGQVNQGSLVFSIVFFECVGVSYVVLDLVCSDNSVKWLASRTVPKWCLCRGVSLHKDQSLQDPLTFKQKQNSSYELFWFFIIFLVSCSLFQLFILIMIIALQLS